MIIAILTASGFGAGQAFGYGFGSKLTLSGLNVVMALIAARVMIGPLNLRARIAEKLQRRKETPVDPDAGDLPHPVSEAADVAVRTPAQSSTS
jgi:hypothetical protein